MDANMIAKGDVNAVAMAIWSLVHGLVSLAISKRMDKLVDDKNLAPSMHQALNWLLNSIDQSIKK